MDSNNRNSEGGKSESGESSALNIGKTVSGILKITEAKEEVGGEEEQRRILFNSSQEDDRILFIPISGLEKQSSDSSINQTRKIVSARIEGFQETRQPIVSSLEVNQSHEPIRSDDSRESALLYPSLQKMQIFSSMHLSNNSTNPSKSFGPVDDEDLTTVEVANVDNVLKEKPEKPAYISYDKYSAMEEHTKNELDISGSDSILKESQTSNNFSGSLHSASRTAAKSRDGENATAPGAFFVKKSINETNSKSSKDASGIPYSPLYNTGLTKSGYIQKKELSLSSPQHTHTENSNNTTDNTSAENVYDIEEFERQFRLAERERNEAGKRPFSNQHNQAALRTHNPVVIAPTDPFAEISQDENNGYQACTDQQTPRDTRYNEVADVIDADVVPYEVFESVEKGVAIDIKTRQKNSFWKIISVKNSSRSDEKDSEAHNIKALDFFGGALICSQRALIVFGSIIVLVILAVAIAVPLSKRPEKGDPKRLQSISNVITQSELSSILDLESEGTPQNKALNWLANDDPAFVTVAESSRIIRRYILALFYFVFDGPNWQNQYFFLTGDHECRWHDEWDKEKNMFAGVTCDQDHNIIYMDFGKLQSHYFDQ